MPVLRNRIRRLWDSALVYLPAAILGGLALGSWWLVNQVPETRSLGDRQVSDKAPEYFMRDFSIRSFDEQGTLSNELQGNTAQFFPQRDAVEVDGPRVHARSPQGVSTVAIAQRAISNSEGSQVQLLGDAVVSREGSGIERMEIRGQKLQLWPSEERVQSDDPVELVRGADRFTADRMRYDHNTQQLELLGRVRGTLVARNSR